MQERNVISGFTAVLISPLVDFYSELAPYLLLAIVLILLDLRWGLAAAKVRGEAIRASRAWRRTINKTVDYICWVTLAGLFGQAFGEVLGIPLLAGIMMLVVYGIELNSCFSNYFAARGMKLKFNVFKFLGKRADIIEPEPDNDNQA